MIWGGGPDICLVMKRIIALLLLQFCLFGPYSLRVQAFTSAPVQMRWEAEQASIAPDRAEAVEQKSFASGQGVSLKPGVKAGVDAGDVPPDLTFRVKPAAAGRYVFVTNAAVDDEGRVLMEKSKTKHDSLFLRIGVGKARPTKRVVFTPWSPPEKSVQTLGIFELSGGEQDVRIWLPEHVRLDYLDVRPYTPPKVPADVTKYLPEIMPPETHPRVWVNADSLAQVKANLTVGENAKLWAEVQKQARAPYPFDPAPNTEVGYDSALENAALAKAFVYLMTGDEQVGRDAVGLMQRYLDAVEFGNLLDITREIGRAIFSAAQVYDWCYDLMTPEERESLRKNMMRLAEEMEIGWPPFKQGVVNGHGSEAQLLAHLLTMAIALHDEDPVPYQYTAYRILEELVPMRNFEYQSPRHHQGIGYGLYRFGWDMHAAWLFYRMTGSPLFHDNIKNVHKHWLYMRLPGGASLADGDGTGYVGTTSFGMIPLLTSAYAQDPIMKGELLRQNVLRKFPVLGLLLNDPHLAATDDYSSLPLTLDFGPSIGGQVARTGWNMAPDSSDVVVAYTGGGYHFGNHQHADAGSFQIYYHGVQVADLGQYLFYGTPYDMNFNKRSIAHSMLLARDPGEKFAGGNRLNDGGQRFEHVTPGSLKAVTTDPRFQNGNIISSVFGPSAMEPDYSYFSVDLTNTYSKKMRHHTRTFCFLNLKNEQVPAALIILDNVETSGPEVTKHWQVNTLTTPTLTADGALLSNSAGGKTGQVFLQMLRPGGDDLQGELFSGAQANSVAGEELTAPQPQLPQATGHRLVFTPKTPQTKERFLAVLTMAEADQTTAPVEMQETEEAFVVSVGGQTVVLSKDGRLLREEFVVELAEAVSENVTIAGLAAGTWKIDGQPDEVKVEPGKNTATVKLTAGRHTVTPVKVEK